MAAADDQAGIEAEPGHYLQSDLAGGYYQVPEGFHLEHEVRTRQIPDGHHLEFDNEGRERIIEDGYTLGPDGAVYESVDGHLMVADSLLRDGDVAVEEDFEEGRYRVFHPKPLEPHYRVRGREGGGGQIFGRQGGISPIPPCTSMAIQFFR